MCIRDRYNTHTFPTRYFREFGNKSIFYPALLRVLLCIHTLTRNFGEFSRKINTRPETSVRSVRPCNNTWGADTIGYTRTGYLLELRIHHPNPTRYICEIIKQYEVYCLLFWKHINPTEHTKLFSLSLAQIRVYHRETRVERAGTLPEGLFPVSYTHLTLPTNREV